MKIFLSVLLGLCALGHLAAADFTVTNTNDSGPGSLRQALIDGESSSTRPSVIKFQIPGEGVHTINLASPLPTVPSGGIVDGYTQPGARPNSLATGTDAVLRIEVNASALPNRTALQFGQFYAVVRGLVLNGDVLIPNSSANQMSGCYIGTDSGGLMATASGGSVLISGENGRANIVGGTTPADRNVIATSIVIAGPLFPNPSSNKIQGNYVGVAADGGFLNPDAFVSLNHADGNTIGGEAAGAGNVIAGSVQLSSANGTLVQGNLIGTTGMIASPGAKGLSLGGNPGGCCPGTATNNIVSQNVIVSTNSASPAVINFFYSSNNSFRGNLIGVAADGKTPLGNRPQGISFGSAFYTSSNNTIGGTNAGDGNIIMFGNGSQSGANPATPAGVSDIGGQGRNFISGNSISGAGGLGIDLAMQGVTPNDAGDADGIQNYPVLTSAVFANGAVRIAGSLNSTANTSFRIELFGNDKADPSGYGQGQSYLGFTNVTTDANGNATFDVTLPVPGSARAMSSTATGPTGTSEFSATLFPKLLNISTRANVQTGNNVTIGGLIITGTDVKRVLLRGIGPSLKVAGSPLPGRLQDPVIDLFDSAGTPLAEDSDWKDYQQAEIQSTGLAPSDDRESALLMSLPPAAYTVHLRGQNGTTGIGVVEVYDLGQTGSQLGNISTRGPVGIGDDVLIGGVIVGPNGGGSTRVLVRGIGPSLASIPNRLQDPMIELWDGNGALLASNDDWKTNEPQVAATGIPPTDDRESALVADLAPGNYTAIVRGKGSATGIAVIEIYNLY